MMLTTTDNPYDPFEEYEDWNRFDQLKGYNSMNYLARVTRLSNELSEADENIAINNAIKEIVAMNIIGVYKKVEKNIE